MSRDFLLVLGGGLVSLVTTLVVLYVTDLVHRRDQAGRQAPGNEAKAARATTEDKGS